MVFSRPKVVPEIGIDRGQFFSGLLILCFAKGSSLKCILKLALGKFGLWLHSLFPPFFALHTLYFYCIFFPKRLIGLEFPTLAFKKK